MKRLKRLKFPALVHLKRASVKDPTNSATISRAELPYGLVSDLKNHTLYELTFSTGDVIMFHTSRLASTLYSGRVNKKTNLQFPNKLGQVVTAYLVSLKEVCLTE